MENQETPRVNEPNKPPTASRVVANTTAIADICGVTAEAIVDEVLKIQDESADVFVANFHPRDMPQSGDMVYDMTARGACLLLSKGFSPHDAWIKKLGVGAAARDWVNQAMAQQFIFAQDEFMEQHIANKYYSIATGVLVGVEHTPAMRQRIKDEEAALKIIMAEMAEHDEQRLLRAHARESTPSLIACALNYAIKNVPPKIRVPQKTYLILDGISGYVKIGRAANPERRRKSLQTGTAIPLELLGVYDGDLENELHKEYKRYRVLGEWFSIPTNELASLRSRKFNVTKFAETASILLPAPITNLPKE